MDRTIEAALQMGLTIKWLQMDKDFIWQERKMWEQANNKTSVYYDRYEGPQKLVVSQFSGLFLLTLIGFCMAFARLLAEFFKFKKENGWQGTNQNQQRGKLGNALPDVMLENEKRFVVREVEKENYSNNSSGTSSSQSGNNEIYNSENEIREA